MRYTQSVQGDGSIILNDDVRMTAQEILSVLNEIESLKQGMRDIYEVWAGSEVTISSTAEKAYQQKLIEEMKDIAAGYLEI